MLLTLCVATISLQAAVPAVGAVVDFEIKAGDLATALQNWAIQSGAQIIYAPELVRGREGRAVNGSRTAANALAMLLRDSGVQAQSAGANTWLLRRAPIAQPSSSGPMVAAASLDPEAPARQLGVVDVYSRPLQRIAAESSIPVTVITRTDIDSSGYLSLFDLLRAQPGVQVTNQPERMGGNAGAAFETGASGAASVGLRRLGAKATLILLNGRRMTGYGLAADSTGSVADISAIPLAMVERIDILRDGASTLYGADAMAGVIDISLRKDFSGTEAGLVLGSSSRGDVLHRQTSAAFGRNFANEANIVVMLDLLDRDPLSGDRRDWYSLDRRHEGLLDARSIYSFPGNREVVDDDGAVVLQARAGCRIEDLDAAGVCRDDRAKATSLATGKKAASLRGYFNQPIGAGLEIYVDASVTVSEQYQQSAPNSARISIPRDDGVGSQQVDHAFWDVGPVQQATQAILSRLDTGVRHGGVRWNWDLGIMAEQSRVDDHIDGLVNRDGFLAAATALGYRFDQRPAPAEIAALLAPSVTNAGRSRTTALMATLSGELAQWKQGSLQLDAGLELRGDSLHLQPDDSLVSGDLLIVEPVQPFSATRESSALYGNLDIPLMPAVNADVGLRLEHAEAYGGFAAPALALRWLPSKSVLLRAGTARGRRIPTLLEQRGLDESGGSSTYEYRIVPEALMPCAQTGEQGENQCFLELRPSSGSPLRPERSRSINAGVVWEPWIGFSIGIDLYELRRDDEIDLIPVSYALQHPEQFPGFLQYDANGALAALNIRRVNVGSTTTRGADLDLRWHLSTQDYGEFDLSLGANRLYQLSFRAAPDSQDYDRAGFLNQPRITASTALRWSFSDWATTLSLRHVGGYGYRQYDGDEIACPWYRASARHCSTPGFSLVNLNIAYAGVTDWRIALHLANLFDHRPRFYSESSGGYNALFDDPVGRYVSISARRKF